MFRRSNLSIVITIIASSLILGAPTARADPSSSCPPESGPWDPISAGPIVTDTGVVCGRSELIVEPYFFYNRTRGVFDSEGGYKGFIDKEKQSQFQEQLQLQFGITDWLQLDAIGAYQQNLKELEGQNAESAGFGDTYLGFHLRLLQEGKYMPQAAGLFILKLPTGKFQKADEGKLGTDLMGATSGGGSYEESYGVALTKKIKPFVFHADAIYNVSNMRMVDDVKTRYGNYVNLDASAEYFLPKGFSLMSELNWFSQGDQRQNGGLVTDTDKYSLTMGTGIGWACNKVQTEIVYQRTLAGENVNADDSLVATVAFTF